MAHSAGDAHEYPIFGYHFRAVFPIRDVAGDLITAAAALDSERSIDQGTAADCTNEATEIATASALYFLDLTGAELTSKNTIVKVKSTTTDSKDVVLVLYPQRLVTFETGTAQAGAAGTVTLASGASPIDGFYNGMFVGITNDSPAGVDNQVRKVISYVGSTQVATVEANWGTNPSVASTYEILLPDGFVFNGYGMQPLIDLAQGIPPATPYALEAMNYLYSALRNKGVADKTANEKQFFNDGGTLIWKKPITKTSTVYTEDEGVSGP